MVPLLVEAWQGYLDDDRLVEGKKKIQQKKYIKTHRVVIMRSIW